MPLFAMSEQPSTSTINRYPCKQCGARLEFAPGTDHLTCPYCGCMNEIGGVPKADEAGNEAARNGAAQGGVQEIDYLTTLRDLSEHAETFERMTVKCGACAAEIAAPENVTAFSCPFCGSNIVATAHASTLIKPNAVLPFKLTREAAVGKFREWLKSLWFAPTLLKSDGFLDASFSGVYVPAWTYDADTRTRYTGQRGDAYYETQWVTVNGQKQARQVRKIRWSPAAGVVETSFDDVLVMATKSLREDHLESLDPWSLPELVAYRDEYLAGFKAECYTVTLEQGFVEAKERMRPRIESVVCGDIGGDEQRISSMDTAYSGVTFKHILLPVWLSAYRFRNTVYRFMVNARTGEIVGERPYSPVKITLFVLMCLVVVGVIVVIAMAGSK